jgi:GNAT superfamily N-acetyltransferase
VADNLVFRACTEKDRAALVRLNLEFMQEAMAANPYWMELNQPSAEKMERIILNALAMPESIRIFVAELDGEIVGFANTWTVFSVWSGGKALTIDDLYVALPHRMSGIGKFIMEQLTQYAKTHDYKRLQLHAELDNHKAHKLYKMLDFKEENVFFFMKSL